VSGRRCHNLSIFGLIALLVLRGTIATFCQSVETLEVSFSRTTTSVNGVEEVTGTVYFRAPEEVVIKVQSPVLQWTIFQGKDFLIYYPLERKAFRFISRNRLMIPFAQSFIGLVREDFGLAGAGFTIAQNSKQTGILTTVWEPPRSLRSYIGSARTGMQKGATEVHPLYLEFYSPKGKLLTRVTYLEYREDLRPSFPARILIQQTDGENEIREEIRYFEHRINKSLPAEVTGFKLPVDVTIEELKW
jgi:outer membrane lipoprotein-sorting protein